MPREKEKETEFTLPGKLFLGIASETKHVCTFIRVQPGLQGGRNDRGTDPKDKVGSPCHPTLPNSRTRFIASWRTLSFLCLLFILIVGVAFASLSSSASRRADAILGCCTAILGGNNPPKQGHNPCNLHILAESIKNNLIWASNLRESVEHGLGDTWSVPELGVPWLVSEDASRGSQQHEQCWGMGIFKTGTQKGGALVMKPSVTARRSLSLPLSHCDF